MNWFARFLLWETALVLPSYAAATAYQGLLIQCVSSLLGHQVLQPSGTSPDLAASNMLGVFVAMCLASVRTPVARRIAWTLAGLVVLTAIECATGIIAITAQMAQTAHGVWPPWGTQLLEAVLALQRFTAAPVVWLLTLGQAEISVPSRAARQAAAPAALKSTGADAAHEGTTPR